MGVSASETPDGSRGINIVNEYALHDGQNLPNHSMSLVGRSKFIVQGVPRIPMFRTRGEVYRYAAYLLSLAEVLPEDEYEEHLDFPAVLEAVQRAQG